MHIFATEYGWKNKQLLIINVNSCDLMCIRTHIQYKIVLNCLNHYKIVFICVKINILCPFLAYLKNCGVCLKQTLTL